MATIPIPGPLNTPYEYVGDIPALGSLSLTKLAKSYEELEQTSLAPFFPTETIEARTIRIETIKYGLGLMPIVQMGKPAGAFMEPDRIEVRSISPAYVREDDFLDQGLINQLRAPGTFNENYGAEKLIADRVRKLITRHNRTVEWFRVQAMLGAINYYERRTNYSINVSTQIPTHNFLRYDGWDDTLGANATATLGSVVYTANKALTNNKGRKEALLFTDGNTRFGVSWAHPNADIVRSLKLIKQYLHNTNKNKFTDIIMSSDLYTLIQENSYIKQYLGSVGIFSVVPGQNAPVAGSSGTPPFISFGPGGDITSIAGLNIILVDNMFRNPINDEIELMWPNHKVAIVARNHYQDRANTLGKTVYCVGESPDGRPGLWMRTGPDQTPPLTPGRTMQMGNAFLPYAVYPQWISLIDVCEPSEINNNLILSSDVGYGTY